MSLRTLNYARLNRTPTTGLPHSLSAQTAKLLPALALKEASSCGTPQAVSNFARSQAVSRHWHLHSVPTERKLAASLGWGATRLNFGIQPPAGNCVRLMLMRTILLLVPMGS